jgi:hypothetical protein
MPSAAAETYACFRGAFRQCGDPDVRGPTNGVRSRGSSVQSGVTSSATPSSQGCSESVAGFVYAGGEGRVDA